MADQPVGGDPFTMGYLCGLHGGEPRDCPHRNLTCDWVEWIRGYNLAVDYLHFRETNWPTS